MNNDNLIAKTEGNYIPAPHFIMNTSLRGSEYVAAQKLLARDLKLPPPLTGQYDIHYGVLVQDDNNTLYQVFESSSYSQRISRQLQHIPVNTAPATLSCKPDLRQLRFDVQHTRISDPVVAQELRDFVMECYSPSLARLKQRGGELTYSESQDVAWPSSTRFLTQSGYYDTDHARSPRSAWPYDSNQDAGLVNTGNGGYPTCKQWWSDADVGLKPRLLAQVKPDVWQSFQKLAYSKENYEEAVLRSLINPRNMEVSQGGRVYPGYGDADQRPRPYWCNGRPFAGLAGGVSGV